MKKNKGNKIFVSSSESWLQGYRRRESEERQKWLVEAEKWFDENHARRCLLASYLPDDRQEILEHIAACLWSQDRTAKRLQERVILDEELHNCYR